MAEKFVIHGGQPLRGDVAISGAKNSVLKLMAASLLTPAEIILNNVPSLSDVDVMKDVIAYLGCEVSQNDNTVQLRARELTSVEAPYELVSKMRASFTVLGALLGRCGEAKVSLPGGCSIGKRGVDLHVKGLEALGAEIEINHGYVSAKAKALTGAEILLDIPSVGATENIMLAAVLAKGSTVISNAAQEPEILDLANFLNTLGADVNGAGTTEIVINGVKPESLTGATYSVVPDRIEASTYLMAAVATHGDVTLHNVFATHLSPIIYKLQEVGAEITTVSPNSLRVQCPERPKATNIVTLPYPGFPTDLQAPMMALLTTAEGVSIIKETIYENRFKQIGELKRMGAEIQQEGNVAVVTGVEALSGAQVRASDLRAGAALVIAGLQAHGTTEILDLHHLDRGYEALVPKLNSLGADMIRVPVEEDSPEKAAI
ncbi:MAG: UDP-N-acetylglucosamine 1-carboxyvinyltransferase [Cyanobacteria bacterium]|nr:UDP-N-acetylglucosamine 1-carboxyvinyltransferase [Cyanobacteriota bacterium]